MTDSLWVDARRVLAGSSDATPIMATIDEFNDRLGQEGYEGAEEMVTLLTLALERRTIVRTSRPSGKRLAEIDKLMTEAQMKFTNAPILTAGRGLYSLPFGPYYQGLSVPLEAFQFTMLDEQPVKHLTLINCREIGDVAMFLRNDRTNNLYSVELRWNGQPRDLVGIAQAVKEAKLGWCQTLTLSGVTDINRVVAMSFIMAKGIYKGTRLLMGRPAREQMTK